MEKALIDFHSGKNYRAYEYFSPARRFENGKEIWRLRVWAPRADGVSVVGDFNGWDKTANEMKAVNGIWECEIEAEFFAAYKFCIRRGKSCVLKADPFALHSETAPSNASKLYAMNHVWHDGEWIASRDNRFDKPLNIYEVHIGSWRRYPDGNVYDYRKFADEIVSYVKEMNYTHIELLPVTEYPFDGSWGYQVSGMFAPTSRYGEPEGFAYLVDKCHEAGIGVIIDWVSAHFPKDGYGLYRFDGEPLYEYADPLIGEHREWGTVVFDYSRPEVRSFLISSAMFFAEVFHVDGIRMDAVASMLYLDYGRRDGEWRRNAYGGNYNLDAIDFIRQLNTALLSRFDGFMMIAEESTAFPLVTAPAYDGGLGFTYKWNMGWMNDNLNYISLDPFFRKDNHDKMTFSLTYAFSENYILPLSHDEVVHGKRSLIGRMQGDYDEKFESYKTFLGFMTGHPGKKLLFMGGEFAQFIEWDYTKGLDWLLLDYDKHRRFRNFVKDLNALYLNTPALYEQDRNWDGFRWLVVDDRCQNVFAFARFAKDGEIVVVVTNFSPVLRVNYRIGVPTASYRIALCSSDMRYGGKRTVKKTLTLSKKPMHGYNRSIRLNLEGNSVVIIKSSGGKND
ncbi:MAG: 1,4-alpha-glucan branching protein GlgB [Christensenellales bacterium]